jgi:hypothetical protein
MFLFGVKQVLLNATPLPDVLSAIVLMYLPGGEEAEWKKNEKKRKREEEEEEEECFTTHALDASTASLPNS